MMTPEYRVAREEDVLRVAKEQAKRWSHTLELLAQYEKEESMPIYTGPWTSHGHKIEGGLPSEKPRPTEVARCGGPVLCSVCGRDFLNSTSKAQAAARLRPTPTKPQPEADLDWVPEDGYDE